MAGISGIIKKCLDLTLRTQEKDDGMQNQKTEILSIFSLFDLLSSNVEVDKKIELEARDHTYESTRKLEHAKATASRKMIDDISFKVVQMSVPVSVEIDYMGAPTRLYSAVGDCLLHLEFKNAAARALNGQERAELFIQVQGHENDIRHLISTDLNYIRCDLDLKFFEAEIGRNTEENFVAQIKILKARLKELKEEGNRLRVRKFKSVKVNYEIKYLAV